MWVVVGGRCWPLLVSHLSRYTKGEVERIWLFFYPWIAIAGAALISRLREWSGAIVSACRPRAPSLLQAALVSKW